MSNVKSNFISITDLAYNEIRNIVEKNKSLGIRISCQSGGCAGYKYDMSIVHDPVEADKVLNYDHFNIYIDKGSILKVVGSVVDYNDNDFEEGFSILNSSNKSYCGCGKSFS